MELLFFPILEIGDVEIFTPLSLAGFRCSLNLDPRSKSKPCNGPTAVSLKLPSKKIIKNPKNHNQKNLPPFSSGGASALERLLANCPRREPPCEFRSTRPEVRSLNSRLQGRDWSLALLGLALLSSLGLLFKVLSSSPSGLARIESFLKNSSRYLIRFSRYCFSGSKSKATGQVSSQLWPDWDLITRTHTLRGTELLFKLSQKEILNQMITPW